MKMMTIALYTSALTELAAQIKERFSQIRVSVEDTSLWLRTESCSGHVGLVFFADRNAMFSRADFSRGAALLGSMEDVMCGLHEYKLVYDALVMAVDRFANWEIVG